MILNVMLKIANFCFCRRLPIVFAMHKYIHQIEEKRQAIFVGFFGPIGVSAIFYLYISVEFLDGITVDGVQREDAKKVAGTLTIVVWFLAICSIVSPPPSHHRIYTNTAAQVVHGLSIPLGKLGFFLPRTLSRAFTSPAETSARSSFDRPRAPSLAVLRERKKRTNNSRSSRSARSTGPLVTAGGVVSRGDRSGTATPADADIPSTPQTPPAVAKKRTIRFPDSDPPPLSLDEPGSATGERGSTEVRDESG
jgi:sodium/hydrogen antiporter